MIASASPSSDLLRLTTSYCLWEWADHDLPGRPAEVHAALLRGEMHPALQTFDARPLLKKCERAAAQGRKLGEEWDWQLTSRGEPKRAVREFHPPGSMTGGA